MHHTIYLASRSPRRVELLKQIGFDCKIVPADIDESALKDERPQHYVLRLAREKALATKQLLGEASLDVAILAADTTVALGGLILGKPLDDADAYAMLQSLSGSKHEVHTAVAVAFNEEINLAMSSTIVEMMPLTNAMINTYIMAGEHRDKAGSYGIQGLAGAWIKHIEGSYSGVMGLPVHETAMLLNRYY